MVQVVGFSVREALPVVWDLTAERPGENLRPDDSIDS